MKKFWNPRAFYFSGVAPKCAPGAPELDGGTGGDTQAVAQERGQVAQGGRVDDEGRGGTIIKIVGGR